MMKAKIIKKYFGIEWFGNSKEYLKSKIKIMTLGQNPSIYEFDKIKNSNKLLRFDKNNLKRSFDDYFNNRPYKKWFNGYEKYLNKIFNASYYNSRYKNRVIHTDLFLNYPTAPSWGRLSSTDKIKILKIHGNDWIKIYNKYKPDFIFTCLNIKNIIIDFSKYIKCLSKFQLLKEIDFINEKKKKTHIYLYKYKDTIIITYKPGTTPFAFVSKNDSLRLIKLYKNLLKKCIKENKKR